MPVLVQHSHSTFAPICSFRTHRRFLRLTCIEDHDVVQAFWATVNGAFTAEYDQQILPRDEGCRVPCARCTVAVHRPAPGLRFCAHKRANESMQKYQSPLTREGGTDVSGWRGILSMKYWKPLEDKTRWYVESCYT